MRAAAGVPGRLDGDPEDVEAFLPRHFTRGKDGAPDTVVPPLTKESDRGDGMAVVHDGREPMAFNWQQDDVGFEGRDYAPPVVRNSAGSAVIDAPTAGGPDVPVDPKPDGPRYAAMGDAVTVNVIEWIGVRILACERHHDGR